ncbi:hemolysin-III family protein [Rhexocercosporidium sp. MPI-PUGE-AT-0058]|nr:hemolysin-III family protein [Rhexocercosporidium sp. MPI-PUGE-AT-0058]
MASAFRLRIPPLQPPEGYRLILGSAQALFYNWSYIHNELVNIYSHLISAVFFLLSKWYIYADLIAFSIFILAAATSLSLLITVAIFILSDLILGIYIFMGIKYRLFRALIFIAISLFGIIPLVYRLNVFGILQIITKAFPYTLVKTRFPESSYSIFHILIVCAIVIQLIGYLNAFDYA